MVEATRSRPWAPLCPADARSRGHDSRPFPPADLRQEQPAAVGRPEWPKWRRIAPKPRDIADTVRPIATASHSSGWVLQASGHLKRLQKIRFWYFLNSIGSPLGFQGSADPVLD